MKFIKKHWSNILFFMLLILLVIPQTRMPIQVFVQRLISFSPSEVSQDKREVLNDYQWELQKLEGGAADVADSRERVTIINLWATWCPPCVAEMPSFQKLYESYGKQVDFYFVTSEEPEKVQRFMAKNDYTMPVFLQSSAAPNLLQSNALPTTFVISKTGEIVINETGTADWNSKKMHKLLDKLLLD